MPKFIPAFNVRASHNGADFTNCKDVSLSLDVNTAEHSGTSQGAAQEFLIGQQSWQVRIKQLIADDGDTIASLHHLRQGSPITVRCTIGGVAMHGDGFVTKLKAQFNVRNAASADVTIVGHGPLIPEGKTGIEYDVPVITAQLVAPSIAANGGSSAITAIVSSVSQTWRRYLYGVEVSSGTITSSSGLLLNCTLVESDPGVSISGNIVFAPSMGTTEADAHVCARVAVYYELNGQVADAGYVNVVQGINSSTSVYHPAVLQDVPSLMIPASGITNNLTLINGYTVATMSTGEDVTIPDTGWHCSSSPSWIIVQHIDTTADTLLFRYTVDLQSNGATQRTGTLTFTDGTHTLSCSITQAAHTVYLPVQFTTDASLYASGETVRVTACYVIDGVTAEHLMTSRITQGSQQLTIPYPGRDLSEISVPLKWLRLESSHSPLGDVAMLVNGVSQDFEPKGSAQTYLYPTDTTIPASAFTAGNVRVSIGITGGLYQAPYIGANGNWYINGEDTGKPSRGSDGFSPQRGSNGNWWAWDDTQKRYVDTGVKMQGETGTNAYSPYVGSNGNWFVYDDNRKTFVDSGKTSKGDNAYSPQRGSNGNWWEWDDAQKKYVDTGIKMQGEKGIDAHSPYVGSNGNWFVYDDFKKAYIDSGRTSKGDNGNAPRINQSNNHWEEYNASTGKWEDTGVVAKGEKGDNGDSFHFGDYFIDRYDWGTDVDGYAKDDTSALKSYYEINGNNVTIHYYNRSGVALLIQSFIYMQYVHDSKLVNYRFITTLALSEFDVIGFTAHTPTGDSIYSCTVGSFNKVLGFTPV